MSNDEKDKSCDEMDRCISMFQSAHSDSDKMAALFILTKMIKPDQLVQHEDRAEQLLNALGDEFLWRLLNQSSLEESNSDESKLYESVALSFLSNFPSSVLVKKKTVLEAIPRLIDIVTPDNNKDVDLTTTRDVFIILKVLIKGGCAEDVIANEGFVGKLVRDVLDETLNQEEAFDLIITLLQSNPSVSNDNAIKLLTNSMTASFATSEDPFELCSRLSLLISTLSIHKSLKPTNRDDHSSVWLKNVRLGLRNILMSKIGQEQRYEALSLVANVVLSQSGSLNFALDEEDKNRFLATAVNVACIELIVLLDEDRMVDVSELTVLGSCFCIIEAALVVVQDSDNQLDDQKRIQMINAIRNALVALCKFVVQAEKSESMFSEGLHDAFVVSAHRLLIVGLADDGLLSTSGDVVEALKPIYKTACKTFEVSKSRTINSLGAQLSNENDHPLKCQPDLLRLLLPGFCHLVTESKSRNVLLNELRIHEVLSVYFTYHLTLLLKCKQLLPQERFERSSISEEPSSSGNEETDKSVVLQETDSKFALITLCNVFMNICLDRKEDDDDIVNKTSVFFTVLRTCFNALRNLDNSIEDDLDLYGHVCVLSLLLLKYHSVRRPQPTDASIYKFAQDVIRFLWDAHNCEESSSLDTLVVSSLYSPSWKDGLSDLWYLAMQTLCSLMSLSELSWLTEFVFDSGFAKEILITLQRVRSTGIDESTKLAFEDLLVSLLNADVDDKDEVLEAFRGNEVVDVCRRHQLKYLAKAVAKMNKGNVS